MLLVGIFDSNQFFLLLFSILRLFLLLLDDDDLEVSVAEVLMTIADSVKGVDLAVDEADRPNLPLKQPRRWRKLGGF